MPRPISTTTKSARASVAKRARPGRGGVASSRAYDDWLIDRLRDPKEAAAYLEAAIEDGDQGVLMLALRHVALAQGGVAEIARRSQLTREATYRMLSAGGNPELRSLTAVLAASGLRLSVKPMGLGGAPRRPRRHPVAA